jgi:hypothetical protein
MSVNEKMTAIADAIREKTGGTDALTLDGMAESIPEVYEAGKQAEYDAFWDAVFLGADGNFHTYMTYHFAGRAWNDRNFRPKYDIKPVGTATGLFRETAIVNLKQCLESCGVTLDTSRMTSGTGAFGYGQLTILPKLDFSSLTGATNTFTNSSKLHTIEEMVVSEKTTFASTTFTECTGLTHMIMTGTLAKNGLDLHWSTNLDKESLLSIIGVLQTKTSGTWTVTLGTENLAKLTDAEKAVATQKGWTLV